VPYPTPPPIVPPDPWHVGDLTLRLPSEADDNAIVAACQDADIRRFTRVPAPYTYEDARAFVALAHAGADDGTALHLVVVERSAGTVLAAVGLMIDWRDGGGEVGYWATPQARGHGVVTTAAGALCRYGFEQLGLPRLWLQAAASNAASNAVARRLGFAHEGTLRSAGIDGDAGDLAAPRVDMHVYGLLAGEFSAG
jgi:RimJ/RimL family protein N-acetyltransferase